MANQKEILDTLRRVSESVNRTRDVLQDEVFHIPSGAQSDSTTEQVLIHLDNPAGSLYRVVIRSIRVSHTGANQSTFRWYANSTVTGGTSLTPRSGMIENASQATPNALTAVTRATASFTAGNLMGQIRLQDRPFAPDMDGLIILEPGANFTLTSTAAANTPDVGGTIIVEEFLIPSGGGA